MSKFRIGIGWLIAHAIAMPVTILWLIHVCAENLSHVISILVDDRRWTIWLLGKADAVERWGRRN